MCRCPFTNDFATSSARSATDHPRATHRQPCPLLALVPPMSQRARLQGPSPLGAMATATARRRAGWMISRSPRDKSSSVPVATATATGLENSPAARSRCRVLSANASAHPPRSADISSGPRTPSLRRVLRARFHATAEPVRTIAENRCSARNRDRGLPAGETRLPTGDGSHRQRPHVTCSKAPTLRALGDPSKTLPSTGARPIQGRPSDGRS